MSTVQTMASPMTWEINGRDAAPRAFPLDGQGVSWISAHHIATDDGGGKAHFGYLLDAVRGADALAYIVLNGLSLTEFEWVQLLSLLGGARHLHTLKIVNRTLGLAGAFDAEAALARVVGCTESLKIIALQLDLTDAVGFMKAVAHRTPEGPSPPVPRARWPPGAGCNPLTDVTLSYSFIYDVRTAPLLHLITLRRTKVAFTDD